MKNLNDVKTNMGQLYEEVRSGKTELKVASELANIAGKYLKAEQLQLAREIFVHSKGRSGAALPPPDKPGKPMLHGESLPGGKVSTVFDLGNNGH
jgi:hypothetical protein